MNLLGVEWAAHGLEELKYSFWYKSSYHPACVANRLIRRADVISGQSSLCSVIAEGQKTFYVRTEHQDGIIL